MTDHFAWWRRWLGHIPLPVMGESCQFVALCAKCGSVQMYRWSRVPGDSFR